MLLSEINNSRFIVIVSSDKRTGVLIIITKLKLKVTHKLNIIFSITDDFLSDIKRENLKRKYLALKYYFQIFKKILLKIILKLSYFKSGICI